MTATVADVDLAAYGRNLIRIAERVAPATVMAVVKADGYGHGLVETARAARSAGVSWLGVATAAEAMTLRASGDDGRVVCWLHPSDLAFDAVLTAGVDVAVSGVGETERVLGAVGRTQVAARLHLKIDTGLSRNGCPAAEWPRLCAVVDEAVTAGAVEATAVWTHLAAADEPGHAATPTQLARFDDAVRVAHEAGLRPALQHVANSAGALLLPDARRDLVRIGIAGYGVEPDIGIATSVGMSLEPVMTLRSELISVKAATAGDAVSYGHTWTTERDTRLGLVPLGYADGIPRIAGNRATVTVAGRQVPIVGRVCMDQFVVDLGPDAAERVGDPVTVFGAGGRDVNALAADCDTIGYEILTRIGSRVPRRHHGDPGTSGRGTSGRGTSGGGTSSEGRHAATPTR